MSRADLDGTGTKKLQIRWHWRTIIGLALLSVLISECLHAGNLYRYKNKKGFIVLDDRVPPQYVAGGYEVLSKGGQVLRVILPKEVKPPGSAEKDKIEAEARKREDNYILASYSRIEEINQARERKLNLLEREIKIIEANLEDTRKQRAIEFVRAANYQRAGKQVPNVLKEVLEELEELEKKAEPLLQKRRKEVAGVDTLYKRYETRFLELTEASPALSPSVLSPAVH